MNNSVPVYSLSLPQYNIDSKPQYDTIGPLIDRFFEQHFPHKTLAIRAIDLSDHPNHSRTEIIQTILTFGTDRYDPKRRSMHHDYFAPLGVELHAVAGQVTDKLRGFDDNDYIAASSFFGEFIRDFYESAQAERGYSLRLDIVLVYELEKLVTLTPMGYAFREPDRKRDALLAVVNILNATEAAL